MSCAMMDFDVRHDVEKIFVSNIVGDNFPYHENFTHVSSDYWLLYRDAEYIAQRIPEMINQIKAYKN